MKISQKLLYAFLSVSLLTLLVSYVTSLTVQNDMLNSFEEVGGEMLPGNVAISRMTTELYHVLAMASRFAEEGDVAYKSKIEKALSTLNTYKTMHMLYHSAEDEAWHEEIDQSVQRYTSYITEYILLVQGGAKAEELHKVRLKIDEVLDVFMSSINPHLEAELNESSKRLEELKHRIARSRKFMIGATLLIIFTAFGLSLFISRLFLRPILKLRDAALEIGRGKLDIDLQPTSKDEIGELTYAFKDMIDNLSKARGELVSINQRLEEEIAERRQAGESLRDSEERYANLFSSMKDVIIMADEERNIITANQPALSDLFGYGISDIAGKKTRILYADDKGFSDTGKEIFDKHDVLVGRIMEVDFRKRDGTIFAGELYALKMFNRDGVSAGNIGIIRDITGRKTLEKQLLQAQKMESIGTLAGGVAHDFNNFLTAIVGYGNLIKMKTNDDDPARHYIDAILGVSEKAAHLTQSLLAFSRKQIISPKPINLNRIVQSIYKLLTRLIGEEIELNITAANEDLIVHADSVQIEQILMNLATNAKDAMPDGGTLSIVAESVVFDDMYIKSHGYGSPGPFALISVTDSGIGMDKETADKIFEPFFTTKDPGKGTGLGLAMVYGIVKQHNGYINIYSELNRGTTFKIYFPLIKEEVEETEQIEIATLSGGTETVLVAEDDEEARKMVKTVLEAYGYKVIESVDGEDAVRKFRENKAAIQLLILDVIMPKKNGKAAFDEIKKERPEMKALFTSGYTADIIHKKGILEEKLNFISKPFSPQDILIKVRDILDAK